MGKKVQCGSGEPVVISYEATLVVADIILKVFKRNGIDPILDIELKAEQTKTV